MPAHFNQVIRKTIDFFQIQSTFNKSTQDSTAARCAQGRLQKSFVSWYSVYIFKVSILPTWQIDDSLLILPTSFFERDIF